MLASSLVAGINWVLQVMCFTTEKLIDLRDAPEYLANLNLAYAVLQELQQSSFFICMLYLGCKEDQGAFMSELKEKEFINFFQLWQVIIPKD